MSSKNNITGVTGEYFVAAELGKRNILALTTPKKQPVVRFGCSIIRWRKIYFYSSKNNVSW